MQSFKYFFLQKCKYYCKQMHKNIGMIVLFITAMFVIFLVYEAVYIKNNGRSLGLKETEMFVDNIPDLFTTLEKYNFSNIDSLKSFVIGPYNEPHQKIDFNNTLALYYSSFSASSIEDLSKQVWKNMSEFLVGNKMVKDASNASCSVNEMDQTFIEFSSKPPFDRMNGIILNDNIATGPPSYQLGITGAANFTLFFTFKFMSVPTSISKPIQLFNMYANTQSNNGLSITIKNIAPIPEFPTRFRASINVVYSGISIADNQVDTDKAIFDVNTPVLLMLTRKDSTIIVSLKTFNGVETMPRIVPLKDNELVIPPEELGLLFSNKRMEINKSGSAGISIYNFGIYSTNLLEDQKIGLYDYISYEIMRLYEMEYLRSFLGAVHIAEEASACPYGEDVCSSCPDVTTWTSPVDIVTASDDCRKAIDAFCSQNPHIVQCECWDPKYSTDTKCQKYINVIRSSASNVLDMGSCVNPTNIDPDTLSMIKNKYNLMDKPIPVDNSCPLTGNNNVQTTNTPIVSSPSNMDPQLERRRGLFIDPDVYRINNEDVTIYNNYVIVK